MIDLIFHHASEVVIVKIRHHQVTFGSTTYGAKMADISGIRLDFNGTIREFPDLKNDIDWQKKAIIRFKRQIRKLDSEDKIADYIIRELKNNGYIPKLKQKAGMRQVKIE